MSMNEHRGSVVNDAEVSACNPTLQDLVIPAFKWPAHYSQSFLLGQPDQDRNITLFFKGDVGNT
eukprot:50485-Chlamydomonas_euryale.AAC.2